MARALISGTGLIGPSIALGLRGLGWETLGWDVDPDALAAAASAGAVDPVHSLSLIHISEPTRLLVQSRIPSSA